MIEFLLVGDGGSDRALLPILSWAIRKTTGAAEIRGRWADVGAGSLSARVAAALSLFPCDVLFVHRDAEAQPPPMRLEEIESALAACPAGPWHPVPVVPVRMTEAWLLTDPQAIRAAAGNPNGKMALDLPAVKSLEQLPDPKMVLRELLLDASGLSGLRRRKFPWHKAVHRISESMDDFRALEELESVQGLLERLELLNIGLEGRKH